MVQQQFNKNFSRKHIISEIRLLYDDNNMQHPYIFST